MSEFSIFGNSWLSYYFVVQSFPLKTTKNVGFDIETVFFKELKNKNI